MRMTSQNVYEINYICGSKSSIEYDRSKLINLVLDAVSVNMYLEKINPDRKIYIDYETEHTEYSPEWTDPCPDFYGMFQIINSKTRDSLGVEMTIEDLDTSLCLLYNYIVE